jgi:hypothetical protein
VVCAPPKSLLATTLLPLQHTSPSHIKHSSTLATHVFPPPPPPSHSSSFPRHAPLPDSSSFPSSTPPSSPPSSSESPRTGLPSLCR